MTPLRVVAANGPNQTITLAVDGRMVTVLIAPEVVVTLATALMRRASSSGGW